MRDIREVAPTIYLAAPRAWDNMLTRIQIGMANSTPLKRKLYDYFMPRAIERERRRLAGKSPTVAEKLSALLGEVLVFGPIKDFLGMTRTHRAYTGGEAMGEDTFLFFRALRRIDSAAIVRARPKRRRSPRAAGAARSRCTASATRCRASMCASTTKAKSWCVRVPSSTAIRRSGGEPDGADRWLAARRRRRLSGAEQPTGGARPRQRGRTYARRRTLHPQLHREPHRVHPYVRNVAVVGAGRDELTAIVYIDLEAAGH